MALPRIYLAGNVVADPELRFTQAGKGISKFRVAANESRKNDRGEWETTDSTFLDVTCFEPLAEPVVEALRKGAPVVVEGRLKQRSYEDSHGAKRTAFEVVADTVALVVRGGKGSGGGGRQAPADPWAQRPTEGPGNTYQTDEPPF
jgi:single-strand DNA-binding protein